MTNLNLFTTETAGLPEVLGPDVTRLADGDRLDLRIGPVRKNIDGRGAAPSAPVLAFWSLLVVPPAFRRWPGCDYRSSREPASPMSRGPVI